MVTRNFTIRDLLLTIVVMIMANAPIIASPLDAQISKSNRAQTPCSDATFIRRSYLLLTGELPPTKVVESFLDNKNAKKRATLIDELLDSEGYIRYAQMRWGDILRIKSEFPSNLWPNGVQAYNQWLYHHIMNNTPYNDMVRDLLISTGSNFKDPEVNFYRAFLNRTPEAIYENINLLFLGQRSCSDNGYECFSQIKYKSTKEWKEEIIYLDVNNPRPAPAITLADKSQIKLSTRTDWRVPYVDWLTSQEQFAAVMVNRAWYWIFGKGLVDEPDDWRADNLPSEPKLLKHLTSYFIKSGYDIKALMSYILNSECYSANAQYGSLFEPRRLPAEVIVDALADVTGFSDTYQSRVPEPFTYYPPKSRSRDIGDATVSSSALELFGKPSRDVSLESQRNNAITSRQLLYLMNSSELESQIRRSQLLASMKNKNLTPKAMVDKVMLTTLARRATVDEVAMFEEYARQSGVTLAQILPDIIWVAINSNEFLYIY